MPCCTTLCFIALDLSTKTICLLWIYEQWMQWLQRKTLINPSPLLWQHWLLWRWWCHYSWFGYLQWWWFKRCFFERLWFGCSSFIKVEYCIVIDDDTVIGDWICAKMMIQKMIFWKINYLAAHQHSKEYCVGEDDALKAIFDLCT